MWDTLKVIQKDTNEVKRAIINKLIHEVTLLCFINVMFLLSICGIHLKMSSYIFKALGYLKIFNKTFSSYA